MQQVRRFSPTEIAYHWAQALPYLALASSGILLWMSHFATLSPAARRWGRGVHLVAAALQIGLPLLVCLVGDRRALLRNLGEALRWGKSDLLWVLCLHGRLLSRRITLPEAGMFNAGQKLNYLLVLLGIPAMAASGVVMYLRPAALAAWYVHIGVFCVNLPLLIVHLWMSLINPGTRPALHGILRGTVSREWALHHHGRWLRSLECPAASERDAPPAPAPRAARRGRRRRTRAVTPGIPP